MLLFRSNQAWRVQQQLKKKILDEKQTKKTQSKKRAITLMCHPAATKLDVSNALINTKRVRLPIKMHAHSATPNIDG